MKIIPLNPGESVIEPFWDPQLSRLQNWKIRDGRAHGLQVSQSWCYVKFDWGHKPRPGVPALCMSRAFTIDVAGFDDLLISIVMPKKSGIDAVKSILVEDPQATVVMCSALGQETLVMEALQAGAKDFIVKPFKPDAVLTTLHKILDKGE